MRTRYRIMYNGEVYKVQEMAIKKLSLKLKRYWKNTTETRYCMDGVWTEILQRSDKKSAIQAIERLKQINDTNHIHKLHMKKFKKENPSGWRKV